MPEPEAIMGHIGTALNTERSLAGKTIMVTAGATREPIDPVRFISNHSSGRMGVAIAEAARRRGARVILVAGHLEVPSPTGTERVDVVSTREMRDAVAASLPGADALIMAAAPADFRPKTFARRKIKKGDSGATAPTIELVQTDDILATTFGARKKGAVVVGFALETEDLLANGSAKLERKKLDFVVANSACEPGAGFRVDTNRVTIISRDGTVEELPLMPKMHVAEVVLDKVEKLLDGR